MAGVSWLAKENKASLKKISVAKKAVNHRRISTSIENESGVSMAKQYPAAIVAYLAYGWLANQYQWRKWRKQRWRMAAYGMTAWRFQQRQQQRNGGSWHGGVAYLAAIHNASLA
jgi:hypothetical protein